MPCTDVVNFHFLLSKYAITLGQSRRPSPAPGGPRSWPRLTPETDGTA